MTVEGSSPRYHLWLHLPIAARIAIAIGVLALAAGPVGLFLTPMGFFILGKVIQELSGPEPMMAFVGLAWWMFALAIKPLYFTLPAALAQAFLSEIAIKIGKRKCSVMASIGAAIGLAVGVALAGKITPIMIFNVLIGAVMGTIYWLIAVKPRIRLSATNRA